MYVSYMITYKFHIIILYMSYTKPIYFHIRNIYLHIGKVPLFIQEKRHFHIGKVSFSYMTQYIFIYNHNIKNIYDVIQCWHICQSYMFHIGLFRMGLYTTLLRQLGSTKHKNNRTKLSKQIIMYLTKSYDLFLQLFKYVIVHSQFQNRIICI